MQGMAVGCLTLHTAGELVLLNAEARIRRSGGRGSKNTEVLGAVKMCATELCGTSVGFMISVAMVLMAAL